MTWFCAQACHGSWFTQGQLWSMCVKAWSPAAPTRREFTAWARGGRARWVIQHQHTCTHSRAHGLVLRHRNSNSWISHFFQERKSHNAYFKQVHVLEYHQYYTTFSTSKWTLPAKLNHPNHIQYVNTVSPFWLLHLDHRCSSINLIIMCCFSYSGCISRLLHVQSLFSQAAMSLTTSRGWSDKFYMTNSRYALYLWWVLIGNCHSPSHLCWEIRLCFLVCKYKAKPANRLTLPACVRGCFS